MAENVLDSPTPSRRESVNNSRRASHGSASTRPTSAHSPILNLDNLTEVAAPSPVVNFFDGGAIRRRSSLEDYRQGTKPKDKHTTWPLQEHHLPGISVSDSGSPKARWHSQQPTLTEEDIISPYDDKTLDEATGPLPAEDRDENQSTVEHTTLDQSQPHSQSAGPSRQKSEGDLIQERKSSRRRNDRIKMRRPKQEVALASKKRHSSPPTTPVGAEIVVQGPGSRSKEDATALPSYPYSVENLEEQLAAAQQLSITSSDLSKRRNWLSRLATELYTVSYLVFFSIMGTLARLGLEWLTFYPGAPVVLSVLWANFAGTLFLGFLSEDRRLFREEWGSHSTSSPNFPLDGKRTREDPEVAVASHGKIKKTIPLYIGLATGFCGSLTSFSAFMRDVFLSLSNNLPTPLNHPYPTGFVTPSTTTTIQRNGGFSFMAIVATILLTLCLCLTALKAGAHIAITLDPWTPILPFTFLRKFFDRFIVFLGFGCWLGAVFMCIWPIDPHWRSEALFACVFAPLGCLTRFYISLYLNPVSVSFPLGTFAVNIFGTAVEGMAFDLQHVRFSSSLIPGGGAVGCQVLQGVMDGFCGSLTTVSTWVLELNGLKRAHAYFYGAASLASGLALLVIIMGSVRWTVGWEEIGCLVS